AGEVLVINHLADHRRGDGHLDALVLGRRRRCAIAARGGQGRQRREEDAGADKRPPAKQRRERHRQIPERERRQGPVWSGGAGGAATPELTGQFHNYYAVGPADQGEIMRNGEKGRAARNLLSCPRSARARGTIRYFEEGLASRERQRPELRFTPVADAPGSPKTLRSLTLPARQIHSGR